jgi:hypothetical protein
VNTLFNGLLNQPGFAQIRQESAVIACRRDGFAGSGGPALAEDHWNRGGRRLRPHQILASPDVQSRYARSRSIGVPLPSTEMKCVDDQGNEVAIGKPAKIIARGPQIMPVTGASPAKPEMSCAMAGCSPATSGKWMPEGYFTYCGPAQGHDPRLRLQCLSQ